MLEVDMLGRVCPYLSGNILTKCIGDNCNMFIREHKKVKNETTQAVKSYATGHSKCKLWKVT